MAKRTGDVPEGGGGRASDQTKRKLALVEKTLRKTRAIEDRLLEIADEVGLPEQRRARIRALMEDLDSGHLMLRISRNRGPGWSADFDRIRGEVESLFRQGGIRNRLRDPLTESFQNVIIGKLNESRNIETPPIHHSPSPETAPQILEQVALPGISPSDESQLREGLHARLESLLTDERLRKRRNRLPELANLAIRAVQADFVRDDLARKVEAAREAGASWSEIGRAVGITPQAAHRRWDADAKAKHRDYHRKKRAK